VLEAGFAVAGGAKSKGAITSPDGRLVEGVKNLRSISGEIFGSELAGAASGVTGLLVAVKSTGAADGAAAAGVAGAAFVWVSVATADMEGGGSGGGRGILTTLVAGGGSVRKRSGAGPTAGK
jgi:hypothetical protein